MVGNRGSRRQARPRGSPSKPRSSGRNDHAVPTHLRSRGDALHGSEGRRQQPYETRFERLDKRRRRDDDSSRAKYLMEPKTTDKLSTTVYLWEQLAAPQAFFGDDLALLDNIRQAFLTYISFTARDNCFILRSESEHNVSKALIALKQEIRGVKASINGGQDLYLVDAVSSRVPSSENEEERLVLSDLTLAEVINSQRVATAGEEIEQSFDAAETANRSFTFAGKPIQLSNTDFSQIPAIMVQQNKSALTRRISESIDALSSVKSPIRMRVHFGRLILTTFRKRLLTSDLELSDITMMLSESRTRAKLDKCIGDEADALDIISRVCDAPQIFEPLSINEDSLRGVLPSHTLIVVAQGPNDELLRREEDLMVMSGQSIRTYCPSNVRWFKQSTDKVMLNIGAFNLERLLDWTLTASTEESMSELPAAFKQFNVGVSRKELRDELRVRYPVFQLQPPSGINIEAVVIRSRFSYGIRGSRYVLDVDTFREWQGQDMLGSFTTKCAVMVRSPAAWDFSFNHVGNHEDSALNQEERLEQLFPQEPAHEDGTESFLKTIRSMQTFLASVLGEQVSAKPA